MIKNTTNLDSLIGGSKAPIRDLTMNKALMFREIAGGSKERTHGPAALVRFMSSKAKLVKSLLIDLQPIQNLHGYDHPWPGGGGKNLYSPSWATSSGANSTVTANGEEIHVVTTGGTTYSGMSSQSAHDLPAGTYYVKFKVKTGAVTGTGGLFGLRKRSNNTFAATSSFSSGTLEYSFSGTTTEPCYFSVLGNGSSTGDSQASDFTLYDIIISTEDVDYEPYSNICPITGWTGVNIHIAGKNLLPETYASRYTSHNVTMTKNADGSLSFSGIADSDAYFYINRYSATGEYDFEYPSANYKLSSGIVGGASDGYRFQMTVYDKKTHAINRAYMDIGNGADVAVGENETEAVYLFIPSGKNMDGITLYPMLTFASETDQAYEPYKGGTYNVDWTSEAGTVYSGSVDVVTGVLTVDRKLVTLTGTDNWAVAGTSKFYCPLSSQEYSQSTSGDAQISNIYSFGAIQRGGSADVTQDKHFYLQRTSLEYCRVWVYDTDYTLDTFKAALNDTPLQVTYPITPLTYQLTLQEVQTLVGTNNVWSDAGDVTVKV